MAAVASPADSNSNPGGQVGRKLVLTAAVAVAALIAAVAAFAGNGSPIDTGSANVLTLAVYGDAPYGTTPTDTAEFQATPAFIDSINADPKVDLVLHVGDIHSGKQFCTQTYDQSVYDLWTQYKDPVVYTPGDNEWTDCHKAGEGGGTYNKVTHQIDYVRDANGNLVDYAAGNPVANLDLIRSIFFAHPGYSLGGRKKQVISQAQAFDPAHPADAKYVENVMWEQSKVLFVTIDLPGGSNNDLDPWYGAPSASAAQLQESAERTGADLRWLDAAFAQAKADGVQAVLIGAQADMWDPANSVAHLAAYEPFVQSIASHTTDLGKPVLLINGDSHEYLSDDPLSASDPLNYLHPGYDVPNFHRIVVHGSTFPLEWLKLTVDPQAGYPNGADAFGPFSWTRQIQPQP
jgi:Calcineurin-like phosphoesterase